ncbi:MAG: hypothetical protein JRE71_21765, partial [Deltaproteobacteria bacterium]|nr:hypothetical protein [Deltaproteobacteria bacterium]
DPDNDDEDLILGGDIRVAAGSEVHSGGGTIGLLAGSIAFANTGDSTGGSVFLDGLLDSGGGGVTLEAMRSLSISERETHNFGGLIQIGQDAVIETNGGQVDIRSQTDPAATTLHDGKTTVRIFGEIDTRVYDPDTTLLDLDEEGGEIDILSDGSFGRVELNYLRGDTDPMFASNGGDVSILSNGSTTIVQGTIDTRFAGSVLPDEDEIAGEIEIASVSLTSLQAVAGNGIRLLADSKLELTAGLDGVQDLRFDTQNGTITLGADAIELRARNGLGSFSTSQVDFSSADSGLQLTNAAGDANPLELLIGQDAAIGSDNLPDADQFIDGVIDVEKLTLQSFDHDIQLANIAITVSDELTLSAREGIAIDQATTSLNVGSSLNLEVYDAFTVDDALAMAINNAAPEINITAGALDTIANLGEAGLTIDAAVLSAGDSLLLHAGAGGAGDLSFENDPTLMANEITLWAGDGSSLSDTPQVVAVDPDDGSDRVAFTLSGGARAFTLRQSASISDDTIPNASQFNGGIAGPCVRTRARSVARTRSTPPSSGTRSSRSTRATESISISIPEWGTAHSRCAAWTSAASNPSPTPAP